MYISVPNCGNIYQYVENEQKINNAGPCKLIILTCLTSIFYSESVKIPFFPPEKMEKIQKCNSIYIPACFGVYSTKKLEALFSITFGIICLPVGPKNQYMNCLLYKQLKNIYNY